MTPSQQQVVAKLIEEGQAFLKAPRKPVNYETGIPEAEELLNDLEHYPHLFVFGCVMDRQMPFGRAWVIPYLVGSEIGGFDFTHFLHFRLSDAKKLFSSKRLHRFKSIAAEDFHSAIRRIHDFYSDNAANIWSNNPRAAAVVRRFLEFDGVGIKIATMAANLLVRNCKVPMTDLSGIDISPDRQVRKFFVHHSLIRENASNEELIFLARELYPEFPGILDVGAFAGGRELRERAERKLKGGNTFSEA